jgi:hypothetical protein
MANKANENHEPVEETQGGAEQPQEDTMEQLANETQAPQQETAPAPEPQATTATATAPGTPVSEVKRTPSLIAETNMAKAAELRTKYQKDFDRIGNNMSEKIRFLSDEGLSKGDISRVLQIQFQFVRNVVFNYDMKKEKAARDEAARVAAEAAKAS